MTFKISKATCAELHSMRGDMENAYNALTTAVDEFNDALQEAWSKVEDAQTAFNEAQQQFKDRLEAEVDEMQGEFDDKSEKWQEGDRGTTVGEWLDGLREIVDAFEDVALDCPESLEQPDVDVEPDISDEP